MNEPNDTAQEGFDQLKRNLEVRYPEDSDLSLDEFLNVESLLALAVRVCGPGADPRKADRLLSNYQLIRPETIGADGHLMQMARRHLFSLASSTAWRRLLGLYERAEYERYRFFDIANGGMALREHPLTGIDRMPIYIDRLLGDVKLSHKNVVARPKGRYSYTCKPEATGDTTVTGSIRWVTIPDAVPPQTGKIDDIPRKSRRPPIDITLDELISTADEVGEKTGKTHYAAVLRRVKDQGLLKRARGGSTSVADGLRLDEVVSLVGLVGAGKSVLANMLIVCLAKRGLRAVSLLNSVSDVMESVVLLREAGISASPLVSRGRRIERLDEFFDHDDSMLLDHSASKYLETACIMDGLSSSDPKACGYGSTPCRGLRSKKGGANSCPYWDVCPSQAMARESLTSDVVVTTPTGFATMIVGRERKAFFEEALQQFDVVLFDEADRVQAQLDGCFAPSMSFQELIRNAADPTAAAMKRRPDDKMRDFNEELFYDLRQKSEPVAKALLKSVRDDRVAKWRIVKDEAFTSLSLLNDLLEQGLPKQVYEDADKLINPYRFEIAKKSLDGGDAALNKLSQAVATSCEGIEFEVRKTGEVQTVTMYDSPISISGEIDKRQEIADPTAKNTEANGDGLNTAETKASDDGSYAYTIDFRSTSNTWTDEFTVEDDLTAAVDGRAQLTSITTPQALEDYDGKMNVWYRTDKTPDDHVDESGANATLTDGHENPWLSDEATAPTLGEDGRAVDFTGWKLWRADVPTTEAAELAVADLGLEEGEHVTAIRFEYGRVEQGFTTRDGGWDREGIMDVHDDIASAEDTAAENGSHTDDSGTGTGTAYAPAIVRMKATDGYTAGTSLDNYARVDLTRNGGGDGLEDHDEDQVTQTAKAVTVSPTNLDQTGRNVIIGLVATLAAAAAAAAALIYRRRHAYPDPVPAGGEDDGYEEDARGREYRDDRYPDGYDRDPYGYDDGYRDRY